MQKSRQAEYMDIQLPADAGRLLNQAATRHNFDSCKVLAYKLESQEENDVQQVCDGATDSYARKVLYWPNGRLAKPEIFEIVDSQTPFEDISACVQHFVHHLRTLLESNPPYMLPTYSEAFIATSKNVLPGRTTLVLLHKPDGQEWRVDCVKCPIEVELGLTVTSLTIVDETAANVLERLRA